MDGLRPNQYSLLFPFDFIFIKKSFNNNNSNSRLLRVKRACVRDEPVQSHPPPPPKIPIKEFVPRFWALAYQKGF